jgi:hypothetical protein
MKPSVHRAVAQSLWALILGLMLAMSAPISADDVLRIMLEEPVAGEIHGGVGNLRGWAVATDGIDKIEIMIDGEYAFDAPYGGARGDVGGAFPEVANASQSGFSLAYAYSNLSPGSHTISAIAHTLEGETQTSSATFETVRFKQSFISGDTYDMVLDWRTAEQGFEIVQIVEGSNVDNGDAVTEFDCASGLYYASRPAAVSTDKSYRYYEYAWQGDPHICINVYEENLLNGREEKVISVMNWAKGNLPNIAPVNVFYIDQVNASDEAKREHDTDFCNLVQPDGDINQCIEESVDSWGDRSYGGGVYSGYLHNGSDLMIYDDAFTYSECEDAGIRYLTHEYFHTFQTSHLFYFEDKQQFGIRINDEDEGKALPFLPIWIGEGGADFASLAMMSKQSLDFDHYEQALTFLNQAKRSLEGAEASFSLKNFEDQNTRINDEYYAYNGGFMAHVYLRHLNDENFKKLMVDYYAIFAERYQANPESGWKDAFEETFGMSLAHFYRDFDAFMDQDLESQIAIIKSADEWAEASWD